LLIQNGLIFEGLGSAPMRGDIGNQNGKIVAIASSLTSNTHQVVDASGLWVTPGFIDIHTH
jgi:N-acyl-D-aspartate/D-glutamate deacylase